MTSPIPIDSPEPIGISLFTIPEWINEAAVQAELNFSQLLQDAIKEKLHLA